MMHFDVIHGEHRGTVEPLPETGCRKIEEEFHSTWKYSNVNIYIGLSNHTTVRVEHYVLVGRMAL